MNERNERQPGRLGAGRALPLEFSHPAPAVVLLHGYGETGDMWSALAAKLAPNHTVVVPDLRWVMEENPDATIRLVTDFLAK